MKETIKTILCVVVGWGVLSGVTLAAEDDRPVNVEQYARSATNSLRKLPRVTREAALAEMSMLLFMPDGSDAYSSKMGSDTVEVRQGSKVMGKTRVPYRYVTQGAQFIGTDGQLYDYYAAQRSVGSSAHKKDAWKQAKLYIYRAGKDAVSSRFQDELKEMEVQRGIYFLNQMSPELRAALFAEVLGLLFLEDGSDAFTGKILYSTICGERVPYRAYRSGAMFVDAQGQERSIDQVRKAENDRGKAWRTWWPGVKLNIHHAGQEAIFAPFRKEIRAMEEYAAARRNPGV